MQGLSGVTDAVGQPNRAARTDIKELIRVNRAHYHDWVTSRQCQNKKGRLTSLGIQRFASTITPISIAEWIRIVR